MAYFWHIPTILGAVTLGGLSYQGVVKEDWTSQPLPPPNNSSVWSDVNNGSGLSSTYSDRLETARTRDFSQMVTRLGDGVKRFVAPGSGTGERRTTAAVLGNTNAYIGDTWYSGTTNVPRQNTQAKQTTSQRQQSSWQTQQPNTTTRQKTTTTQQRTNTNWNTLPSNSRQVASNAPAPALPAGDRQAFGQGGGYHIVIETDGGMREAQLIEQQLRQAGYRSVESWQQPNKDRVRIFVGDQMAPDVSDREFAKLEKTLRTFTFYSDVTLLQL